MVSVHSFDYQANGILNASHNSPLHKETQVWQAKLLNNAKIFIISRQSFASTATTNLIKTELV